jgi:hypothetical protein
VELATIGEQLLILSALCKPPQNCAAAWVVNYLTYFLFVFYFYVVRPFTLSVRQMGVTSQLAV